MAKQWLTVKRLKMKRKGRSPRFAKSSGYNKASLYHTDKGGVPSIGTLSRNAQVIDDPFLNRLFPGKPDVQFRSPDEKHKLVLQQHPRAMVLAQLEQGDRFQKVVKYNHKDLESSDTYTLRLYFGGQLAFFVSERKFAGMTTIRKSIDYGDMGSSSALQRAMLHYSNGTISWLARKIIPPNSADNIPDGS